MDTWAPVAQFGSGGVGQLTSDSNSIAVVIAMFGPGSNAADCAAHVTVGDRWANVYGEALIATFGGASSKAGFWFRVADSSNYYAAYRTATGVAVDSVVAGTPTSLLTASPPLITLPGVFRAQVDDDVISVFWRGDHVGSVRDSSIAGPGFVSLFLRSTTATSDVLVRRFEAGPLTASYSPGVDVQQAGPNLRHARLR